MSNIIKIVSVVGARPNFMKIAPFMHAIEAHNFSISNSGELPKIKHYLVHTGQHYDAKMSANFFQSLDIPSPDIDLEIGSGSHSEQVGRTMIAFEKVLREKKPDWVVVVGDVNATCACSITAKKEHIKLAHIEAGLRSFDMLMPEEINRLVTDRLADLLLTPDEISNQNLRNEGVAEEHIAFVGNIMIDTLLTHREVAEKLILNEVLSQNRHPCIERNFAEITEKDYVLLTMHRPSNVDMEKTLRPIIDFLEYDVATERPVVWPVHPRTEARLKELHLWDRVSRHANFIILSPVGYHEMIRLTMGARVLMTDSGGLQEESCVLGTPCLTLRQNTERPVTLQEHGGASLLVGNNVEIIKKSYKFILTETQRPNSPPLWDGKTAQRIVKAIIEASSIGDAL
ncbi:MAG: UDP-N-acetylglucosamine 2-epimerase (non-hydrolyzing) [Anaerohalosphaeraceae bacterium]|nr:UDP-N-acetylglucosamine 2-epimerase (non-hydrolyzing) [Anaerohalosphaeraceae bacterium]